MMAAVCCCCRFLPYLLLTARWWLCAGSEAEGTSGERFKIEGRAVVPGVKAQDWIYTARVLVEGEEHVGFFKTDGTFTVNDVPSGSYVVEIVSPAYRFEPVRVDITSKGKIRARQVNYLKASEVIRLPYPIQIKSTGPPPYFMKRETWGWTDFLMNPMVMMMVLPLLIILLLPKVVNTNDPEMRRNSSAMLVMNLRSLFTITLLMLLKYTTLISTESSMELRNADLLASKDYARIINLSQQGGFPSDCHEIFQQSESKAEDGLYVIQLMKDLLVVYCDMHSADGGWTVIQHITVNSSLDFDRTWQDYKQGFGFINGDHWLGNELIHRITSRPNEYSLGIKLVNMNGEVKWGEYDPFLIEDEESKYKIRLGLYRGTATDALTQDTEAYIHDNQKFTTKDSDNDNYYRNCAKLELNGIPGGGWWYNACAGANLNRKNVIYWQNDCNKDNQCKYAWMMVKPNNREVKCSSTLRDEL